MNGEPALSPMLRKLRLWVKLDAAHEQALLESNETHAERLERALTCVNFCAVGEDADRFRARARECRDVAAEAKDEEWRQQL